MSAQPMSAGLRPASLVIGSYISLGGAGRCVVIGANYDPTFACHTPFLEMPNLSCLVCNIGPKKRGLPSSLYLPTCDL
jgi:hypothetical protein